MTVRWTVASKAEKVGVGVFSLSLFIMWIGAMMESGQDLGIKFIGTGAILMVGSIAFILGYAVDW